tara:strand:+ start:97 stop:702 length:606 start_codon:yes stop_codon:yes gene_type:complete
MIKNFILYLIKLTRFYVHQPKILRSLQNLKIKRVFDVGAHEGETIEYLIKLKKIEKIYCFEPQATPFKKLRSKYNKYKNIKLNQIAFSNNKKMKKFYINDLSDTSTFSKINKTSKWLKIKNIILNKKDSIIKTITIKTSTLDEYFRNKNIGTLDLLKIDTEGHELEVLEGSKKAIKNGKIRYILIELHSSNMYKNYSKKKN